MKNVKCPICYNYNIYLNVIKHGCFDKYYYHVCKNCNHLFTDYSIIFSSNTIFSTGKKRADNYINYILNNYNFNSLIEIGSANDFYFLNKIHEKDKHKLLYLHDSYDYSSQIPEYINFLNNDELKKINKKIDICYMCHSLEHIPNIDDFLITMTKIIGIFIIEIPFFTNTIIDELKNRKNPHYHYYSKNSIELKFSQFGFNLIEYNISKYNDKNMMFIFKK